MGLDGQELSELIGDIYDCAFDGTRWVPMLERLAHAVGACNGTILRHGDRGAAFAYAWGVPEAVRQHYLKTCAAVNPLSTIAWHCDIGEPVSLGRFKTSTELKATRFYRELPAPLGWPPHTGRERRAAVSGRHHEHPHWTGHGDRIRAGPAEWNRAP